MKNQNPVLVEVIRGNMVESAHCGMAAVVDHQGNLRASWGDIKRLVYPRSAVKPIQAIPLLETGAADHFELGDREIALACASHNGEPTHTEAVAQWLNKIDLDPHSLECGSHSPMDKSSADTLTRESIPLCSVHNNCSGKHTGFLSICQHLGWNPTGYIKAEHPVQNLVKDALEYFTQHSFSNTQYGIDGCGIPVYGIPLVALARAMTVFTRPEKLAANRSDAVVRIREAMLKQPHYVAGKDRFDTIAMQTLTPNVILKTGAEGVYCAAIIDQGIGIALKIDDGATRASEVAIGAILASLGAITNDTHDQLITKLKPTLLNVAGQKVGQVQAAKALSNIKSG